MQVLHAIEELRNLRGPIFAAIGVFDGVHLGHQAVISTSTKHAHENGGTAVVITFDPHPMTITQPSRAPHLLTATGHKIRLIRALDVRHLLVVNFDRAFAAMAPEHFIEQLATSANPLREICVGHEWTFGRNRAGNLDLLKQLGARFGFDVVGIPPVKVQGEVVSSTAIRRAVVDGDLKKAAAMLGRDYTILGTVKRGAQLGRELGFPTANLGAHSELFPPDGVYAAEARLDGELLRGVANVGCRPTIASEKPQRLVELHLFDLDREIYGKDLEVRFTKYLRPEQKFADLTALQQQIARDVEEAKQL